STLNVFATMNVFDPSNTQLASQEAPLGVSPLAPGKSGTFRIDFGKLSGAVDHQTTELRAEAAATPGVNGLRIDSRISAADSRRFVVSGLVENRSGDAVNGVMLGISFHDKNGELLDVWEHPPVFSSIADGDAVPFYATTTLVDPKQVATYTVYVVGFRGSPSPPLEDDLGSVQDNSTVLP